MHKLKVVKTGGGLAVMLPDEVVAKLDLAEGAELVLAESPAGFTISGESREERVRAATRQIFDHYRQTLSDLAK